MGSRPKSGRRKIRQPLLNCLIQLLLHRINADFLLLASGLPQLLTESLFTRTFESGILLLVCIICAFHAESLGFGITAVTGGTHTFFMREKLDVHFNHDGCTSEF